MTYLECHVAFHLQTPFGPTGHCLGQVEPCPRSAIARAYGQLPSNFAPTAHRAARQNAKFYPEGTARGRYEGGGRMIAGRYTRLRLGMRRRRTSRHENAPGRGASGRKMVVFKIRTYIERDARHDDLLQDREGGRLALVGDGNGGIHVRKRPLFVEGIARDDLVRAVGIKRRDDGPEGSRASPA